MRLGLGGILGLLICTTVGATEFNAKTIELCQGNYYLVKLSTTLLRMRMAIQNGATNPAAFQQFAPYAIRDGKLQCLLGVKEISPALIEYCTRANLTIVGLYPHENLQQIAVQCSDPRQFDELVKLPDVIGVTPEPLALQQAGLVENEAKKSLDVIQIEQEYGYQGKGVRIGVLSDSLADRSKTGWLDGGYFVESKSQKNGEAPPKIRVVDRGDGTGNDEGAAMIELIHDLAPEADISFAAVKYSYAAFPDNIRKLGKDPGNECKILVDDISFLAEPLYQYGPIAQAVDKAVSQGVTYIAAAGNYGSNAHEKPFTDVSPEQDDSYPPSGKDFHDFGKVCGYPSDTHLTYRMPLYSTLIVALHWDEPYGGVLGEGPGAASDLDVYLVSDETTPLREGVNGNILASSVDIQGTEDQPMGEPIEFLVYNNQVQDRTVHVVINHTGGRIPQKLHLFVLLDPNNYKYCIDQTYLRDRTIMGHMVASQVLTVAAMPFQEIDRNGNYLYPMEVWRVQPFSALGGWLPIFYEEDGYTWLSPPRTIFKPDLTAPDNTSTSVPGFETFTGTSAAAANLAAVSALILDASPSLTAAQLRKVLNQSSIDVEKPGPDFYAGNGLVNAYRAIQSLRPSAARHWDLLK